VRRRRALGLSFATAHTIHLGALTTYSILASSVPDPVTIVFGGGAFVVMFAMVATSTDAAVRRLGRNWLRLHKVGIYWLWFVFTFSYAGRVAEGRLFFVPLLALAVGGLGLRIASWRARARRSRPA
jgi:DMSO/TMAO reductase YedYZ heme-binding membrane subunit